MIQLGKLQKIEIRKVWPKEDANFTPWLAQEDNIALLGEELNIELEVQAQEQYVGPFRADILCKDTANGDFVLIENQFGKTDHTHLGQIMTYAAGLKAVTIIWIAEKFVDEHRAALDWLNNITDETVEFFGIEIELYTIGNSAPAPMFNIVCKPNDWSKSIKRNPNPGNLTDTKILQQEYWQALKDFAISKKAPFRMQKPQPQHWTSITIGKSNIFVSVLANTRDKCLAVHLDVIGNDSLENFRKLRKLCESDSYVSLSKDLKWNENEGRKQHQVKLSLNHLDPNDKSSWPSQHEILTDWINKFVSYFKPKVKDL